MGEIKAIRRGGGKQKNSRFLVPGERRTELRRAASGESQRSTERRVIRLRAELLSPLAFYACGTEPEPCLASPLPLRSDSGVEPQSRWGGADALNTECERSVR